MSASVNSLTTARLLRFASNTNRNKKKAGGFTLIELLIVVIIVGILSAIALPAFLGQAKRAKASAAKSLVSSITKECQVALVEGNQASFDTTVSGSTEIALSGSTNGSPSATTQPAETSDTTFTCNPASAGGQTYFTRVVGASPIEWFSINIDSAGGTDKFCSPAAAAANLNGCRTVGSESKW